MRNAMICVTAMLAVFLGWPLAFGSKGAETIQAKFAEARPVPAAKAATVARAESTTNLLPASFESGASEPKAETCYKRYQREVEQCSGTSIAACKLRASDGWDLCEATGLWRN